MFGPMALTQFLVAQLMAARGDAAPDWDDDDTEGADVDEQARAEGDRAVVVPTPGKIYPVQDLMTKAATARYADGRVKRTAYPRVDLSKRRVLIWLHQVGAERADSNARWHLTTAHSAIKPSGTRCRLHPVNVRLVCQNRGDRSPWAGVGIEIGGNFEGVDGTGNWYRPDKFGRGRMSDAQVDATRQEVVAVIQAVADLGGVVEGIAPHIIAGRDKAGRPNRQLCPGSRAWSQVGEWAGAELGLKIPGPKFHLGGMPIPPSWYGPHRARCTRFL